MKKKMIESIKEYIFPKEDHKNDAERQAKFIIDNYSLEEQNEMIDIMVSHICKHRYQVMENLKEELENYKHHQQLLAVL